MQIIFHSHFPVVHTSGVRKQFLAKILFALAERFPDYRFLIIAPDFKSEDGLMPNNIEWIKRPAFSGSSRLLETAWKRVQLPRIIKKTKATLLLETDGDFVNKINIPQILFSPNYALFDNKLDKPKRLVAPFSNRNKKTTDAVFVLMMPSNFHRENNLKVLESQINKTSILYPASFFSPIDELKREIIKSQFTQSCEYFLCDAPEHSKENILIQLKAFSLFKKRLKSNMKLVISGKVSGNNKKFQEELNTYRFRDEVVMLEDVAEHDELIASAYAVIVLHHPLHNPQPLIDALYCEVPSIATDHELYREISDDAGLFFPQNDFGGLGAQMMLIYKDEDLRSKLINAAQKRKNIFSIKEAVCKMEHVMMSFAQNE
jgi:glycosyltransferase involved in cell wall biosynthesis